MKNKISVCIVTRNDEKYIESCLKSVLPVAHEIIVADAGSTDRTKEIVRGLDGGGSENLPYNSFHSPPIRLYETTWDDDYSKARNHCISHATGDWILSIDAGEELTQATQNTLIGFLNEQTFQNEPVIFKFKVIKPLKRFPRVITCFQQALFRNGTGIYYKRPMYEHLHSDSEFLVELNCPFFTIYSPVYLADDQEIEIAARKKMEKLLQLIDENPNKIDNYYYYYHLGNLYSDTQEYIRAVEAYNHAFNLFRQTYKSRTDTVYGNILVNMIINLIFHLKMYKETIPIIEELLKIAPEFPDSLFYLGCCIEYLGNYKYAISTYERVLSTCRSGKSLNSLGLISLEQSILEILLFELGRCYLLSGADDQGLNYLEEGLSISPLDSGILLQLAKYYLLRGDTFKAMQYHFKNNVDMTETDKQFLEAAARLPFTDIRYKQTRLEFLKVLIRLDGWLKEELDQMNNKIAEIEKEITP
jgi:glycosyltransferase involved in cell wall biosynthesis